MKKAIFLSVFALFCAVIVNAQTVPSSQPCTTCGDPVEKKVYIEKYYSVELPGEIIYNFVSDGTTLAFIKQDGSVQKIESPYPGVTPIAVTKPRSEEIPGHLNGGEIKYLILVYETKEGRSYNAYFSIADLSVTSIAGF